MFLHYLEGPARQAFLRAAQFVIQADKVVDLREEVALEGCLRELGLELAELPAIPGSQAELLDDLAAVPADLARVVLLELHVLARSDRDCDPREREVLAACAERLGVEAGLAGRIEEFAERAAALRSEGAALIEG